MPSAEGVPLVRQESNPADSGALVSPTPMNPSPEGPASPGNQSTENSVLAENIQQLVDSRRKIEARKTFQDHLADAMTRFSGSMLFVYVHAAWFAAWMVANSGWFAVPVFDEFPFGLLTMIVSLEAIFLSTFVLVSQNRMGILAERRAELDVHVNLLAEREVTHLLILTQAIVEHLGVAVTLPAEIDELKQHVSPAEVMQKLEVKENEHG
ncbi:MAG: DUF1003 domain-containing protein, partial [Anaerolineaceae bacterium]